MNVQNSSKKQSSALLLGALVGMDKKQWHDVEIGSEGQEMGWNWLSLSGKVAIVFGTVE